MKTNSRAILVLAVGTATLMLGATAVVRADDLDAVSARRVSLDGLDRAGTLGAVAVYRRLRHAAKDVCTYSSAPNAYSNTCFGQALERAVGDAGSPALTALHASRSKR